MSIKKFLSQVPYSHADFHNDPQLLKDMIEEFS